MQLLEREPALDALGGWFAEARAGQGRVVLVGGEAGVGKTTLVNEFSVRHGQAGRILRGACDVLATPRPHGPLADVAPALGGRLDQLLRDEAPREVLFSTLLERLLAARVATVLVIEDAHWADEATLDLLRFLARRLGAAPVLLVVTYRDDEVGPLHPMQVVAGDLATSALVRRLRLAPLSRQGVAVMAGPHGVDPDTLYETTGGNPFFVTEVLAADDAAIPATVLDAVLARAARLSPPARKVLDAAAVVAPPVGTWLLAEAAAAAPDHVDECVAAGMLREQAGGVAFRHELARLAVERTLAPGRRAELHRRALAGLLAQPGGVPDPARLAHHAEEAGGDAAAVLDHAPAAARHAAALGAHREAAAQYARALRFAGGLAPAELAELLEAHAYECYLTDQHEDATASRQRALGCWRELGDRRREGDTLRWLSRLAWFQGRRAEAERAGRGAVELLEALAPGPELAMAYSNLSQLAMLAEGTDEAVAWGGRAIGLAERLGQPEILAHALNNVGTAEMGDLRPSGQATLERSLALALATAWRSTSPGPTTTWPRPPSTSAPTRSPPATATRGSATAPSATWTPGGWPCWPSRPGPTSTTGAGPRPPAPSRPSSATPGRPRPTGSTRWSSSAWSGPAGATRVWAPLDEALALGTGTGEPGELQRLGPVAAARAEAAWLEGDPAPARAVVEAALDLADRTRSYAWLAGEPAFWLRRQGGPDRLPAGGLAEGVAEPFVLQMTGD